MRAKKSLGQHFLLHKQIAQRMVAVSHITKWDNVVEVGPGTGKLTDALLEKAGKVIALETDKDLVNILEEKYTGAKHIEIRHQDIRSFDPQTIKSAYVLVSNIPYYLTSAILRKFLETPHQPKRIVLLVQKEVAHRIARDKKESILSISVKVFGNPNYEFTVPRGAFFPQPSVDSAVLSINNIHNSFVEPLTVASFFLVLHAGFSHKRKKLVNNLSTITSLATVQNAFVSAGITPNARAEDIPVEKWLQLSQFFSINTQSIIKK